MCQLQGELRVNIEFPLTSELLIGVMFQSADDNLSLIPTEEFYAEAPDSISEPSVTLKDPHAQRLARLQWELDQRRKLEQEAGDREKEKEDKKEADEKVTSLEWKNESLEEKIEELTKIASNSEGLKQEKEKNLNLNIILANSRSKSVTNEKLIDKLRKETRSRKSENMAYSREMASLGLDRTRGSNSGG